MVNASLFRALLRNPVSPTNDWARVAISALLNGRPDDQIVLYEHGAAHVRNNHVLAGTALEGKSTTVLKTELRNLTANLVLGKAQAAAIVAHTVVADPKDNQINALQSKIDGLQNQIENLRKGLPSKVNRMKVDPARQDQIRKQILDLKSQIIDLRNQIRRARS